LVSIYDVDPQLALWATDMPPAMRAFANMRSDLIKNMPPLYYKQWMRISVNLAQAITCRVARRLLGGRAE
jgi:hypothetical protein